MSTSPTSAATSPALRLTMHLPTGRQLPEFVGGSDPNRPKKHTGASRIIIIDNQFSGPIRLCFRQMKGKPIVDFLEVPFNPDPNDNKVGWVHIAPKAHFKLLLRDAAFQTGQEEWIRFALTVLLQPSDSCNQLASFTNPTLGPHQENQEEVIIP